LIRSLSLAVLTLSVRPRTFAAKPGLLNPVATARGTDTGRFRSRLPTL